MGDHRRHRRRRPSGGTREAAPGRDLPLEPALPEPADELRGAHLRAARAARRRGDQGHSRGRSRAAGVRRQADGAGHRRRERGAPVLAAAAQRCSRASPWCSRRSGSTASWPTPRRSDGTRSASGWRSVPTRATCWRLVVGQGMRLVGIGLAHRPAGAWMLSRVLQQPALRRDEPRSHDLRDGGGAARRSWRSPPATSRPAARSGGPDDGAEVGMIARCSSGREVRPAAAAPKSRLHVRGAAHPHARNRRQHHHLRHRQRPDAPAARRSRTPIVSSPCSPPIGEAATPTALSYPEYLDYRDRGGIFAGLAAQQGIPVSLGRRRASRSGVG